MKRRIKQLYSIIKKAEAELKKIRAKCEHPKTHVGLYSSRPGDIHNAKICNACGEHLGYADIATLGDWFEPSLDTLRNTK